MVDDNSKSTNSVELYYVSASERQTTNIHICAQSDIIPLLIISYQAKWPDKSTTIYDMLDFKSLRKKS